MAIALCAIDAEPRELDATPRNEVTARADALAVAKRYSGNKNRISKFD
jgi:hypothetical protein